MVFDKYSAAAVGGLITCLSFASNALANGQVWVEGSYEYLALPDVRFVNNYFSMAVADLVVRDEFRNDDGDFDGFRIDGGIANIPIMGGAYQAGMRGFFAWHDDRSDLRCTNTPATPGTLCLANPLIDDTALIQAVGQFLGNAQLFTTDRDVNHWGVAVDVAQAPMGLKVGPAFRRIAQDLTITGRETSFNVVPDPYRLTYREELDTNYWGAFMGARGQIDLGGGWSLSGDGEAGLYWADTGYSGSYVVTNANFAGPLNPNVDQRLSLDSDELAFIGVVKGSLEKDFGLFRLAGFGRVEYISSAPDVAYNDQDVVAGLTTTQGPEDETRLGERYAYTASAGARLTVPMGSGQ